MKRYIVIIAVVILLIVASVFLTRRGRIEEADEPYAELKGLVAFVIDDWGYNQRYLDLLFRIDRPLTVSILPNLRYSHSIAAAVSQESAHDIILHLPLESKSNMAAEADTIRSDMKKGKILSLLDKDISSVPGLVGVSSHQGSKATADEDLMRAILNELKQRKLFFLDSLTTPDSVCIDVARDIRLKCAERDVFLDLTDETDLKDFEAYIRKQIRQLSDLAIKRGSAIGIGHNKKVTLEVIKDSIPALERRGIKIVPLRELVR